MSPLRILVLRVLAGYLSMMAGVALAVFAIVLEPLNLAAVYGFVVIALILIGAGYISIMWD